MYFQYQLTPHQKYYITKNHKRLTPLVMGRNLHAPVNLVRIFLTENDLEAVTPDEWNERLKNAFGKSFNVDKYKGEYSWVV